MTEREIIKRVHEQVRKLRRSGELPPAPEREPQNGKDGAE